MRIALVANYFIEVLWIYSFFMPFSFLKVRNA